MELQDRLMTDLQDSMRSGDTTRREAIRMLRAALKNEEIAIGRSLEAAEAQAVVSRVAKRHRESIEQFQQGNRPDLVRHEEAQLAAVEPYLPATLSADQIELEVRAVMAETGIGGTGAQGQLMRILAERLRGRADLGEVNKAVRRVLESEDSGRR